MKLMILLVVVLAFFSVDAKKKKKDKHEVSFTKKHKVTGPFRMPVFAIRMPIFGGQEMVSPSSLAFNDEQPSGPKEKLKTVTKTNNSTKGPYKIFTIITETKSANKSNPKVFSKIIKTITTMNRNSTTMTKNGTKIKLPKLTLSRLRIFNPLNIFGGLSNLGGDDDDNLSDEPEKSEQDCSDSKICKDSDEFCDNFYGVCKKKVVPFGACSQKDQCSVSKGNFQCTWGRCIKGTLGDAGTFCDKENDCQSKNEELGCFAQSDISRYSKVCVPKLGEGSTCGRTAGIFGMFDSDDEDNKRCQGALVCRTVGFYGRKACIKDTSSDQHDYMASIKKSKAKPKHHKH